MNLKSLFLLLWLSANVQAAPPPGPTLTRPTGDYQASWFSLEDAGPPCRIFVAWREGKPVQFWSTRPNIAGTDDYDGKDLQLKLIVDQATGTRDEVVVDLRLVSIWPMRHFASQKLTLDVKTGTWSLDRAAKGKLVLLSTSFDPVRTDWPSFYGTMSACRGPDFGRPIVDDLAKARPLWRSEAISLSPWGTGADARYPSRAAYACVCGGASSPVVADGLVYLYHYRPLHDGEVPAELSAQFERPEERDGLRQFFAKRADVVVTCLDGSTGKTVWESVWPQKQGNWQTHKWRGLNHTPAVSGGVLVVSDYSMGLHAFDSKSGTLLWTRDGGGETRKDQGAIGPVISGDVVVWTEKNTTVGLDLRTGKELWKAPAANGARRLESGVLLVGPTLRLLDPATGKEIASAAFPGGYEDKGRLILGEGLNANLICDGRYIVSFVTTSKDGPRGKIFALKVVDNAILPAWTNDILAEMEDGHTALATAKGRVFVGFKNAGAVCIDLATGKTIKRLPEFSVHSNPIHVTVDDRLFWQPECQHGRQFIQLFDADSFTPLGSNWRPPHNDSTAYGNMPIANLVVDGRFILRGLDGVYCYDLRATP